MPSGTFTQKIQCQSRPSVTAPPTSGPDATPSPATPPQIPTTAPRRSAGNDEVSRVSPRGITIAAPSPWTARKRDQDAEARRECAGGRGEAEQHQPGGVRASPAEPVAERGGGDDPGGEGEGVGVDDPGQVARAAAEVGVDRGQGGDDDERVEGDQQVGARGQQDGQPAVRLGLAVAAVSARVGPRSGVA